VLSTLTWTITEPHLPCYPECWEQSLLHHPHWQLWEKKRVHIIINDNTKQVIFCGTHPGIKINHPLCILVWYWPIICYNKLHSIYTFNIIIVGVFSDQGVLLKTVSTCKSYNIKLGHSRVNDKMFWFQVMIQVVWRLCFPQLTQCDTLHTREERDTESNVSMQWLYLGLNFWTAQSGGKW